MEVKFWYPQREYKALKGEIDTAMQGALERGDLILRKDVDEFEKKLAAYVGTKYAVGVASGTDALILSLKAMGIQPGDEVITSAYTFRATVEAIHHVGAIPVLVDKGDAWEDKITDKTKACIPAHLEGIVLDWNPVEGIAMIEDACQAIGAAPVRGITACYSFYPAKILGCYGDGGAIATNDKDLYEKLLKMRNHYKNHWGEDFGYNSRLDNLQAAVLNVKMDWLDWFVQRRAFFAAVYNDKLRATKVEGIPLPRKVYQDYLIHTKYPIALHEFLKERGIETMLNAYLFPDAVPKLPKAVEYEANTLRLPCTPYHTIEEIEYVVDSIEDFYNQPPKVE